MQVSPSIHLPRNTEPGLLQSLWVYPPRHLFENLESDEMPLMRITQHWVTRVGRLIVGTLLAVTPLAVAFAALAVSPSALAVYIALFIWLWLSFVLLYFVTLFILWKSDMWLVTNERVINFDTDILFRKRSRDSELAYLHQVDYHRPQGLIRGTLNYGDVHAKFSGDQFELVMSKVPLPEKVALALGELAEEARKAHPPQTGQPTLQQKRTP